MPKISVHGKGIESMTFAVGAGVRLFDVLLEKGLYVENDCGGLGTCGKCKVTVNGKEELACHYIVDDDIDVTIRHTLSKPAHSKELYHIDPVSPILTSDSSGTVQFGYKGSTYTCKSSDSDSCKAVLFDIGTTTVRGQVLDVRTGDILDEAAVYNRQIPYGSDVISRIVYAEKHDAVALLQKKITETLNEIIDELNVKKDEIDLIFCAGNS
ncbi:MAG: 2Fe-2S iron-sulfur cluster binding domain-containing protein, partial [Dehalococcoidales bacterium]|nr:2Fe-2S iron-sulfur cluster binding domain-containing protein [Dehalococcoidales bacterium]